MDTRTIKDRVTIQDLFRQLGHPPDAHGRAQCLFPERHRNADANPSVTFKNNTATCHSQQCMVGVDIFDIVRVWEDLETFPEQKDWICQTFGLYEENQTMKKRKIYNYTDEQGELVHQVIRKYPKSFQQRQPDGDDGWI